MQNVSCIISYWKTLFYDISWYAKIILCIEEDDKNKYAFIRFVISMELALVKSTAADKLWLYVFQ